MVVTDTPPSTPLVVCTTERPLSERALRQAFHTLSRSAYLLLKNGLAESLSAPPMTPWALAKAAASSLMLSEVCMSDFSERGNARHRRPVRLIAVRPVVRVVIGINLPRGVEAGARSRMPLGTNASGRTGAFGPLVHRVTASVPLRAQSLDGGSRMSRWCGLRSYAYVHSHRNRLNGMHSTRVAALQDKPWNQCQALTAALPGWLARSRADRRRR